MGMSTVYSISCVKMAATRPVEQELYVCGLCFALIACIISVFDFFVNMYRSKAMSIGEKFCV